MTTEHVQHEVRSVARKLEWLYRNAFLQHPIGTRAGSLARRTRKLASAMDGKELAEIRPLVEEVRAITVMAGRLNRAETRTWEIFQELFDETGAGRLDEIMEQALERWNGEYPEIAATPEPRWKRNGAHIDEAVAV